MRKKPSSLGLHDAWVICIVPELHKNVIDFLDPHQMDAWYIELVAWKL